jgi:multiple sugar transport system substrate-binding protein
VITLRGMTWDHERGAGPLLASSRAFEAARPDVTVRWEVRSLEDFAHYPVERLAETFDLIAVDHPYIGQAAAAACLAPLDSLLGMPVLERRAMDSIGGSHESYRLGGHQWALAMDAACHVAAGRPDLLPPDEWPRSWAAAVELAESLAGRQGPRVAVPLVATDVFCLFMSVLASLASPAFSSREHLAEPGVAREAFEIMRRLARASDADCWDRNAIDVLEAAATTDDIAYVPAVFGYSNYARPGFRSRALRFGSIPPGPGGVLGGVGIAVSAGSSHPAHAASFAAFVTDPEVQRSTYTLAGGQPASSLAWHDPDADRATGGFLGSTRQALQTAWVRPRFEGMIRLTPEVGRLLRAGLRGDTSAAETLAACDAAYGAALGDQRIRLDGETTYVRTAGQRARV